ncbi:hypothetical protein ACJMK2_009185 [Sinanodonta woodiana]|uniref:Uncharacterized protein n=1 Tax=Sinanodonta woodiana TaxID=1069815 RepID=A0ABD3VBG5_SINWO
MTFFYSIDGANSLYGLSYSAYDELNPLHPYSAIDPYRFVGLGPSQLYPTGGSLDFNNLGAYGFSGSGTRRSNPRRYLTDLYNDLGDYGQLGQYDIGGYNSLYDFGDRDSGNLYNRPSSLGSLPQQVSRYLESDNKIRGNGNQGPYNFGGYSIGNDVGLLGSQSINRRLNDDPYFPGVYPFGNRELRSRSRRRDTFK